MEQVSEGESFSLISSRAMRNGALVFCGYMLVMAINGVIEPLPARHDQLMLFPPNVFPWIPATAVLVFNVAFYAYLAWFIITLIRASRCVEERLIMAAFAISLGLGLLTNFATNTTAPIARYGDLGMWAVGTVAAAKLVTRHRDEPDDEATDEPAVRRSLVAAAALFIGETLLATAGAMMAVALALRLLYPTAHFLLPNITKDSFTALNFLPYFPLQIGAAFALGYLTVLHFKSRSVMFVWILPLAITVLYVCTFQPSSVFQNKWLTAGARLFGASCRPPDCYDQTIVVAPLYAAVAFSLGSWLRLTRRYSSRA